jgi:hypothetical protein
MPRTCSFDAQAKLAKLALELDAKEASLRAMEGVFGSSRMESPAAASVSVSEVTTSVSAMQPSSARAGGNDGGRSLRSTPKPRRGVVPEPLPQSVEAALVVEQARESALL